ncbi:MAG: transcription antitermination factor NusB [Pseudomonadota bacterium]
MTKKGAAARRFAFELLSGVLDKGQSLADQLGANAKQSDTLGAVDVARAQRLANTALRHRGRIDSYLDVYLRRKPPKSVQNILRLGVTEIHIDGIPVHAAVDGAVGLAKTHPKSRHASGLINAVLRKAADDQDRWQKTRDPEPTGWIAQRLRNTYGKATCSAIFDSHRALPPLDLTPRSQLEASELATQLEGTLLPTGTVRLRHWGRVSGLPGYEEGAWWVQDAAAALPVRMLGEIEGHHALDVCAAPGGKTLQLSAAGARVTALDASHRRLVRLEKNLCRTKLKADVVTRDALTWSPEQTFDTVVLDAPCSATGTIRRHPDLPYIRQEQEVEALAKIQMQLLERAWTWIRSGGQLLYCTCSLLPDEGETQIEQFLSSHLDAVCARPDPAQLGILPDWIDSAGGLRLRPDFWPQYGGMDGFYAAVLRKV